MVSENFDIEYGHLETFLYWISQKYREDSYHRNSSSGKDDMLGAFYDRWTSRLSEYVIFEELLENKEYSPIIDFYLYDQETEKDAPDVLGLKNGDEVTKFCEFSGGQWNMIDDRPFIEVKEFKTNQNLVTIPENEFRKTDYFVLTVSHINKSYLINFMREDLFSDGVYERLEMSEEFLQDKEGIIPLKSPNETDLDQDLGEIELLAVLKNQKLKDLCKRLGDSEDVAHIHEIEKKEKIATWHPAIEEVEQELVEGENQVKPKNCDIEVLPFHISKESIGDISVEAKSKSSMYIKSDCRFRLNGRMLESGVYKLNWRDFERGGDAEYITYMSSLKLRDLEGDEDELMEKMDGLKP